jgi:hypothetical protein
MEKVLPMKHSRTIFLASALAILLISSTVALADDLLISGTISGTTTYESDEGIVFEDAQLDATAIVTATSNFEVYLKPGTTIASGASLTITMRDNDGLSNRCEMQYFSDLTHFPDVDDDGDGLTNLEECQSGAFNPNNPDTDGDGASDSCEAPFDTTAPAITLLGQNAVSVCFGAAYNDAGATAADDCLGDITDSITVNNPVDTNVSGTYTVSYDVTDGAGNGSSQVTRTVYVDIQPPVIAVNGDNPIAICLGSTYNEPGASATDNCDGDLSASIVTTNPVDTNVGGYYTVSYDVTDSAGNSAQTVTRTVIVLGTEQTVQINTTYQYDSIGRLKRITKQVQ